MSQWLRIFALLLAFICGTLIFSGASLFEGAERSREVTSVRSIDPPASGFP